MATPRLSMQLLSSAPPCPPPRLLRSLGALGKHLAAEGAMALEGELHGQPKWLVGWVSQFDQVKVL